jgi:hypothetical protein
MIQKDKETYINSVLGDLSKEGRQRINSVLNEIDGKGKLGFQATMERLDNDTFHRLNLIFRYVADGKYEALTEMLDKEVIRRRDSKLDDILQ